MCRSYSDLNFGVTFLEHSVFTPLKPCLLLTGLVYTKLTHAFFLYMYMSSAIIKQNERRAENSNVYKCQGASCMLWRSTCFSRAGFTLSRALFRKKCGGPSTGAADTIFPGKNWRLFFSHHRVSAVTSRQKLATFFCSSLSFSLGDRQFCKSIACSILSFLIIVSAACQGFQPLLFLINLKFFRHAKKLPLLLWGPLFGWTCWTCLNPPLASPRCETDLLNGWKSSVLSFYISIPYSLHWIKRWTFAKK